MQFLVYFMPDIEFPLDFTEEFFLWLINYLVAAIPVAVLFVMIGWVISTLSGAIVIQYSSDMLEERHASLKRGFNSTISSISSLLTVGFIIGILTVLGLVLFILPGIIVTVMFSLSVQVIMIERLGILESLRRSRRLVADRWGKTFAVIFLVFLITAVTYVIGGIIGDLFVGPPSTLKWMITSIVASIAQPLWPIALTHLYYSLLAKDKLTDPEVPLNSTGPVEPPVTHHPTRLLSAFQPRFCQRCGQRFPSDAVYCPRCGAIVRR
jgi:hypothetical protein